ncbi:MAG: nuclear transport factor 2 family protein [Conexibacter sp.]|nr:nuclear transport factor 2 family protein [Conexibacter sp.]
MPTLRTVAPRAALAAALLTIAAGVAAGCGADEEGGGGLPDDQQVRAVVARFGVATRAKDYQTICDRLLAAELVKTVESIGLPCESALQKGLADVRDPRLELRDVALSGGRALVSVHSTAAGQPASDDAVQLVKQHGEWRIASLAEAPGSASSTTPPTTSAPPSTTKPG